MMAYYNQNPYMPQNPYMQQMQQQNGGIIPVRGDEEVIRYPVAPGNSVMFQHVNEPYIYTKSMGLSQFDKPVVHKYRLVEEGTEPPKPAPEYALKSDLDELRAAVAALGGKRDE